MPVMDIGHVSVFVLGAGMLVFVGMCKSRAVMFVEFIVGVSMLMHNGHVDVKTGMWM